MRVSLRCQGRVLRGLLAALALLLTFASPAWAPPFKPFHRLAQTQPAQQPNPQTPSVEQLAPAPQTNDAPRSQQPQPVPNQPPQVPAIGKAERAIRAMNLDFDRLKADFARPSITADQLTAIRRSADELRTRALFAQEELKTPITDRSQQLKRIGDAPVGQPEDASLTAMRQQLFDAVAALETANRQLGLLSLEVEQFLSRVTTRQRDDFLNRLLEPHKSIINPALWFEGATGSALLVDRTSILLANWWAETSPVANVGILLMAPAVLIGLFLLYRALRRRFQLRLAADAQPGVRDDAERLWWVFRGILRATVATAAIIAVAFVTFRTANALTPRFEQLFQAAADFVFYMVMMAAMAQRLAAAGSPGCRIVDLDDQAARQLAFLGTTAAVLSATAEFFTDLQGILFLPVGVAAAQSALAAALMAAVIATVLVLLRHNPGLAAEHRQGSLYFEWTGALVPFIWLVLALAVLALLSGYIALAAFLTQQIIDTAFIVAGLFILHHLSDAVVASSFDPQSRIGQGLRRLTGLGDRAISRLGLLLRTVIDLGLVLIGLPLLFLNWAVTWLDFGSWINAAITGFEIGDVTISVGSILVGLAVFVGGVGVVKLFTLWLDRRVLVRTALDVGVRNSIETGASYAGFLIVAAIALSSAGLNFTNLAIVAGALGVGIGFGLQSIVNNFVSGLILLAERPIKVGDWIKVAGGEGIVKRINVRSTEIETFEKCAIIVPNSSLISDAVANWTHSDMMGRVRIPVGVSYGSDPRTVEKILMDCAKKHERLLAFPQPFVRFQAFGASSLDFELFGYVDDVNDVAMTASDLRYEILRRLGDAGIEIPYAQSDVRLKDLDRILGALKPPTARNPARKKGSS